MKIPPKMPPKEPQELIEDNLRAPPNTPVKVTEGNVFDMSFDSPFETPSVVAKPNVPKVKKK
ncbi:MAG: hypothetical protein V4534_09060 [Myxococcota bacterium]